MCPSGKRNKLRVYYLSWLRNKILHNDPEVEKKQGWTTVGDMEGCGHYRVGELSLWGRNGVGRTGVGACQLSSELGLRRRPGLGPVTSSKILTHLSFPASSEIRAHQVPGHRPQKLCGGVCLGPQALPQVHGLQGEPSPCSVPSYQAAHTCPAHTYSPPQSFADLPHRPLLVDLTVEEGQRLKVIYGSSAGFHAVDVDSGNSYDIYIPVHVSLT